MSEAANSVRENHDDDRTSAKISVKTPKISLSLPVGELSLENLDISSEIKLPKSPDARVRTKLGRLDGFLGLKARAWYRGKRQRPSTGDTNPDEPQREALNELHRFETETQRRVSAYAALLKAEIRSRIPRHYTREEINSYVEANWRLQEDISHPLAHQLGVEVINTEQELAEFRHKHKLGDEMPPQLKPEHPNMWLFSILGIETVINTLFYRSAGVDNLLSGFLLAVAFALAIVLLGATAGAYGFYNVTNFEGPRRKLGYSVIVIASSLAISLVLILGLIRFNLAENHGGSTNFRLLESLGLVILNLSAFSILTWKYRFGFDTLTEKFRRVHERYSLADRRLREYVSKRVRTNMDLVVLYYRQQFLHLRRELNAVRAPVERALAHFQRYVTDAVAAQQDARRDTFAVVENYRERNRLGRSVFSFVGWIARMKKTPAPAYFDKEPVSDDTFRAPLDLYIDQMRSEQTAFESKIEEIEASVEEILRYLSDLAKSAGGAFDTFIEDILSESRAAVDRTKEKRGIGE